MRALLVVCVLCGLARAESPTVPELRKIDWCNWTYANDRAYPMLIKCTATVDQRHSEHGGIWGFVDYRFVSAAYGDLTGDGVEDALLTVETTLRPVLLSSGPPTVRAEFWLMQRRDGLVIYTSESADAVPTGVQISKGVATLQWQVHGKVCEEHWKFAGVGEGAVKSTRTCK